MFVPIDNRENCNYDDNKEYTTKTISNSRNNNCRVYEVLGKTYNLLSLDDKISPDDEEAIWENIS